MSIVILQLPKVKRESTERPKECRYCKGEILQRWGRVEKRVKDTKVHRVKFHRYRCTGCRRTFRHYPEGVQRARQTERLKLLAAVCWSFGLSHRKVSVVLSAFGVSLSRMSSWRDVQAAAEAIRKRTKWRPIRVAGVDGAWQNGVGVMVAVDLGNGQPLAIGQIDERDAAGVQRWLRQLQQEHGITAIVTDDLAMYRGVTARLGLEHQVCQMELRSNSRESFAFSIMFGAGWGAPAASWSRSSLRSGWGFLRKLSASWRSYRRKEDGSYLNCGSKFRGT